VFLVRVFALALPLLFGLPRGLAAHDIPNDITVQAFLRPDGQKVRLLVRAPLQAMRDIDYPRRDREFVDLAKADQALREAAVVWIVNDVDLYEGPTRLENPELLAVRASLPSDESFRSYETALAHFSAPPLAEDTQLVWNQGLLDIWLEYPIQSDRSEFSIDARWGRLGIRTVTALRLVAPTGTIRAFELTGDVGLVRLDPRWHQAALRFIRLGFLHILDGTDHLLFLLCLVIPFRRLRSLIIIVTSFTVAHSITLIASAYDLAPSALWFPPLIETMIAVSIVYMALENIVVGGPTSVGRRWLITFGFGLVHGFGFSFALRETLQFAGSHLLTSLLAFNVGVELGQLLVLALMIPALGLLFRFVVAEKIGTIILSALVAHTGWHWMTERADRLRQYSFQWPDITAEWLLVATRWTMVAVIVAGAGWLLSVVWRHRKSGAHPSTHQGAGLTSARAGQTDHNQTARIRQ
jgi:hypothetical protein